VLEAVRRVRAANANAFYALDPVMGDREGGLYVAADLPSFFATEALALSDLVFPNAFELERLTGLEVRDVEDALAAADALRGRGAKLVVATGVEGSGAVAALAVAPEGAWAVETPRLAYRAHGTGDAFAALFLGHFCDRRAVPEALERAVAGVHGLVEATLEADELALIAAQDQAIRPSRSWPVRRLR
ncbi:MAG: PfkB family carbohydrate kinase, partial [Alphaproteobacteria bacterium]